MRPSDGGAGGFAPGVCELCLGSYDAALSGSTTCMACEGNRVLQSGGRWEDMPPHHMSEGVDADRQRFRRLNYPDGSTIRITDLAAPD